MLYLSCIEMNARSTCIKFVLAISVALAAPWIWAEDGLEGALPRANLGSLVNLTAPFGQTLAIADFDNDHKLDGAVLVNSGRIRGQNSFRIEFHLSGSNNTELFFESTEATLAIAALDVNHDGATDLVVEHPFTHKRLYVWLNDGRGAFHRGRIEDFPSAEAPSGERLWAPSLRTDSPAACLPQQRCTEMIMLAACSLRGRPPSTDEFEGLSLASSDTSPAFSPASSRAPPRNPSH